MRIFSLPGSLIVSLILLSSLLLAGIGEAQSTSSSRHSKPSLPHLQQDLDAGSVLNGVYRNRTLGLSCKIPAGWVLRTEEMNSAEEIGSEPSAGEKARVLLAAFSRPPDARGEDVNASILMVAEPQSSYPGLQDAAQYFGPLTEVAKGQGFTVDEEPYEFAVGAKKLARGDFHKDVGTRVMHQSTLAMLVHGYAVSITVIAGSEDEVEELIDGMTFAARK